jgi:hypothetical protein
MKTQIPCKFVKREGEGCTANNNCKYPNCPAPIGAFYIPSSRGLPFTGIPKDVWDMLDDPNLLNEDKDAN